MNNYTSLLQRQIRRYLNLEPHMMGSCHAFLDAVNRSYEHYERDHKLMQASLKISSDELREQALSSAEKEARLMAIINAIHDEGIVVISDQGKIELCNNFLLGLLGIGTVQELQQQNLEQIKCCIAMNSGRCDPYPLSHILKRASTGERFLFFFCQKDQYFFEISASSLCLLDKKLNIYMMRDISKRHHAEKERRESQKQLVTVARQAGMMQVASSVLHNVGNVLNSVNVTASLLAEKLKNSEMHLILKVAGLLSEHAADMADYIQTEQGKMIPQLIIQLADYWSKQTAVIDGEFDSMRKNIEHIKNTIKLQQSMAGVIGIQEYVSISQLISDLLKMYAGDLAAYNINVIKEYEGVVDMYIDKGRLLQILVNLLRNAIDSLKQVPEDRRKLIIGIRQENKMLSIVFTDNGVGIPEENLVKIFSFGFTSKEGGHGFGLHASSCLAHEMHGALQVNSAGVGQGACFTITLPYEEVNHRDKKEES